MIRKYILAQVFKNSHLNSQIPLLYKELIALSVNQELCHEPTLSLSDTRINYFVYITEENLTFYELKSL